MDLRHEFTVPTGVEQAWAHFNDIASVAECFPGAVVTSVEDETFSGTVKVKLGPIALVYGGSGTFVEKDESAHRFVVEAKGKDKRGNGTAGASVTLSMEPSSTRAGEATDVVVVTDLSITGKPAQFGRGVMQDVSDKLLGQFVACLEQRLSGPAAAGPTPDTVSADEVQPVVAAVPDDQVDGSATDTPPAPATPRPAPVAAPPAVRPAGVTDARGAGGDDALDVGAAVLPVLLRSYRARAGGLVALVLLVLLVRRRRAS